MTSTALPVPPAAATPASGGEDKGLKQATTGFFGVGGIFWAGIGSLVVGVVLMVIWRLIRPPYFKSLVLNKDTPVLVPET